MPFDMPPATDDRRVRITAYAAVQGVAARGVVAALSARRQARPEHQFGQLAAVERQLEHLFVGDHLADARVPRLDQRGTSLHRNGLLNLTELERDRERRIRADLQHDAGLHVGAESLERRFEPVRDRPAGSAARTSRSRRSPPFASAGVGLGDGDRDAGQRQSSLVSNGAVHLRGRRGLRRRGRVKRPEGSGVREGRTRRSRGAYLSLREGPRKRGTMRGPSSWRRRFEMVYPSAIMTQQKALVYTGLAAVSLALLLAGGRPRSAQAPRAAAPGSKPSRSATTSTRFSAPAPTSRCTSVKTASSWSTVARRAMAESCRSSEGHQLATDPPDHQHQRDMDHVGGNEAVGAAGLEINPDSFSDEPRATILSHENVLARA